MAYKPGKRVSNELQIFLSQFSQETQGQKLQLRDLVLELAPEAIEQIDRPAKLLAYGMHKRTKHTICVIIPQKTCVNLGFPRGVDLPDPKKMLEGTGKKARHVKVRTQDEIASPDLRKLLQASIDTTQRV